mgnify:CR=1 FL=1
MAALVNVVGNIVAGLIFVVVADPRWDVLVLLAAGSRSVWLTGRFDPEVALRVMDQAINQVFYDRVVLSKLTPQKIKIICMLVAESTALATQCMP